MKSDRRRRPARGALLLPLLPLALTLWLVAVAPAHAFRDWSHDTAVGKRSCAVGCHADQPPTNATCSGCHSGFSTSGGRWCWTCHAPGQSTSAWQLVAGCTASCHLWTEVTELPSYATSFVHAESVHLGSTGYGKTCTDCHGVSLGGTTPGTSPHHDAVDGGSPGCAGCHDGIVASLPAGHDAYGDVCAACHTGMDRPSGDCTACHTRGAFTGAPQIDFTNDLACADVACHGGVAVHSETPVASAPCTTCHAAHYAHLAVCEGCHRDPGTYHHGAAEAVALAGCAACHDGVIAAARESHSTIACVLCHAGMDRPAVPVVCSQCHFRSRYGTAVCTTCHSATGLTGVEQVHTGTPGDDLACGSCHQEHHADLGACDSCHARLREVHHAVASVEASTLTLVATPRGVAVSGSSVLLAGSLAGPGGAPVPGAPVLLQERRLGRATFTDIATPVTDAGGGFSLQVAAISGREYRAIFRGSSTLTSVVAVLEPALARQTVEVRQAVTLRASPAVARAGERIRLRGTTAPTAQQLGVARPALTLRVERRTGSRWVRAASIRLVPGAGGAFSWTWRPKKAGSYRVTVSSPATVDLRSASARVMIRIR